MTCAKTVVVRKTAGCCVHLVPGCFAISYPLTVSSRNHAPPHTGRCSQLKLRLFCVRNGSPLKDLKQPTRPQQWRIKLPALSFCLSLLPLGVSPCSYVRGSPLRSLICSPPSPDLPLLPSISILSATAQTFPLLHISRRE